MKLLFIILISALFAINIKAQFKCNEDSILTIKGKWKKNPNANMVPGKNLAPIVSRIDKISKMFQMANPEPKGTMAEWYGSMRTDPMVENGPIAYDFESLYQYWYCSQKNNQLTLSDETGNWGRVLVNNIVGKGFIDGQNGLLKTKVADNDVYILPNPKGEWKGYPMYDFEGMRSVIFTHNQQFPWKAITQEQYLQAIKAGWKKNKDDGLKGYAEQIANLKKSIKELQDNKDIKPADKKEIISSWENGIAEYKNGEAEFIKRITGEYAEKIAVIDTYMLQHKNELSTPAIVEISSDYIDNFSGSFSTMENGGHYLVILDPAYFKKALPDYVPQVLVLSWTWQNDAPGLYYKKQLEENFPVEKLKDMIDK